MTEQSRVGIGSLPASLLRPADELCDRFEAAWQAGERPRLEDFLQGFGEPQYSALLPELILVEVAYRRLRGESPEPGEYRGRFPALDAAWLEQALAPPGSPDLRPPPAVAPGERLGRFQLVEQVGAGASGVVWRALDTELDRVVALKILHASLFSSAAARERFDREARAAAQLRHPGIVTVHEVTSLGGLPALVLEFVGGVPLRDLLGRRRLTFREAAALVADVAETLDYAHTHGQVHRDIKPANIMVPAGEDGRLGAPLLLDFGLALRDEAEATLTLDGQLLGTPAYMSPEQAAGDGHRVDCRTDVYSLGVVLYELLCGELPFRGPRAALLHQVLYEEPRAPRRLNDKVPRDLETVCLKAMAKEPHRRYASARAFADDLRRFLAGQPVRARALGLGERALYWARRRPAVAALVGVSAVAALALAALAAGWQYSSRLRAAFDETDRARRAEAEQRRQAETNLYFHRVALAAREWSANNPGQVEQLLGECPPRLRRWEWYYLERLCHRDLLTLDHHRPGRASYSVMAVAYSPDGRQLATASGGGEVRVWDAAGGRELRLLGGQGSAALCVAYSPDGRLLASGGVDGVIRVWDAATGDELRALRSGLPCVYCLAFSPDGQVLASGSGDPDREFGPIDPALCAVKLWDPRTGQELFTLRGHRQDVLAVAFSPDGRHLASADGVLRPGAPERGPGEVKVWDLGRRALVLTLRGHSGPLMGVAYSPDGRRLASAGRDDTVKVWDADGGDALLTLRGHRDWVRGVAFSPDGRRLASASADGTVKLWDAASGEELSTLRGHRHAVTSLAFAPDGRRLASGSSDETVKVWDSDADPEGFTYRGHTGPVVAVSFLPGGRLASASNLVDAAGNCRAEVRVWEPGGGREPLVLGGEAGVVYSLARSPDGALLAAGMFDEVRVWEVATGRPVHALRGQYGAVRSLAFSPDGRRLVSAAQHFETRPGATGGVAGVQELTVWDVATGRARTVLRGQPAGSRAVAFSPDGRLLVSSDDGGGVTFWDEEAGHALFTFQPHDRLVAAVAFSADGRLLATASWDQTVKVWDVAALGRGERGTPLLTLRGHRRSVLSVGFSPDGERLATGSEDQTVKLWDVASGEEVLTLRGHTGFVNAVAFSPDGRRLASAGSDRTVRVWDTTAGE